MMALMATHILLRLKGNVNPSWMLTGHTILRSPVTHPPIHVVGQGQREETHVKLLKLYVGSANIHTVLPNTHIVTQKFQLGKHSIREIINIEENKLMYKENH